MSNYHGPADLIIGSVSHKGKAELNLDGENWSGWFEFDSPIKVEEWRDLMLAESREFAGSPAAIQLPRKSPRGIDVEGGGDRINISGEGTPPWEDE